MVIILKSFLLQVKHLSNIFDIETVITKNYYCFFNIRFILMYGKTNTIL